MSFVLAFFFLLTLFEVSNSINVITTYSSSNSDRRLIGPPEMIVIHSWLSHNCTSLLQGLTSPTNNATSFHYVICQNGSIYRLVAEDQRAWHAGLSYWHAKYYLDDWSIGILHEWPTTSSSQQSLASLIQVIVFLYSILGSLVNRKTIALFFVGYPK